MKRRSIRSLAVAFATFAGLSAITAAPVLAQSGTDRAATQRTQARATPMSSEVRHFADWAVHSGDHKRLPFIIVDKKNAAASAFDASGRFIRTVPVLLGMGVGDTFAPGVAGMDMYQTKPWQRITPAGRFFAEEDLNLKGERVLWVDYDTAIAIHRLPAKKTKQRRHERIASANPADHRITYGCINVPPSFYDQVVHPNFGANGGIVYVLPDTLPLKAVFKSYDVDASASASPMQQSASGNVPGATRKF